VGDELIEIADGETVWRFERDFLESNWRCIYGDGCLGILEEPAPERMHGCCSGGAHFGTNEEGQSEAMSVSAYASLLTEAQWQNRGTDSIFSDETRSHTKIVDGACVFLNRPGFEGGVGCALHIGALDADDSPTEWKPPVCWQLPIRVDWAEIDADSETATVRRWTRDDWGEVGKAMAWCCTERADGGEAYVGTEPVVESMRDELTTLVGEPVYVELRRRLSESENRPNTPKLGE
jgi:hypothetical protein